MNLLKTYRGLNIEDLDPYNPTYSCVICNNKWCPSHNVVKRGCKDCKVATEEEWAMFYNFNVKKEFRE